MSARPAAGVTAPLGFSASAVSAGIKPGRPDLALLVADATCAAAGVFTTNLAQAAPVLVSRQHLAAGRARAVVANAGCANAGTGERGLVDARETARLVAGAVGCASDEVLVASTGVIGVPLPMDRMQNGIAEAARGLGVEGGAAAARAILTTDTKPKEVAVPFEIAGRRCLIGGMAKGAGMIAPRMATLLAFFTTDAAVAAPLLQQSLAEAVGESLNRITVDGDTSTNDSAFLMASGASGAPVIQEPGRPLGAFRDALTEAAARLAELLVRDGEGVTKVARIQVEGAHSTDDADRIVRTIAESPLVKTALHGGDPNWGRILACVGRAGVPLDIHRVSVWIGDVHVAEHGGAREYDERVAAAAMREDPVRIRVRLAEGGATSWMWTSDFSRAYVDINAHYRT